MRITDKTPNERDMELLQEAETINKEDCWYCDGNLFILCFGSYGEHLFAIYARELQESLELTGEYFKNKGYKGLIYEFDPENEYFDDEYCGINGGEFYIRLPGYVREITYKLDEKE